MRPRESIYKLKLVHRIFCSVLHKVILVVSFAASLFTLCLLIYEFGFVDKIGHIHYIQRAYHTILQIFLLTGLIRIALKPGRFLKEKGFWFELIILAALIATIYLDGQPEHSGTLAFRLQRIMEYLLLSLISIIQLSKQIVATLQRHLKPELMFAYSFLFIILSGAFLLMLPNAHHGHLNFINALFTSTSAVCVTGLSVIDVSTSLTYTGQIILIGLIQIGGLGIMTFTSFFAMSFFDQVSFRDQISLKNILNENSLSDIFHTLFYILLTTFTVELIGAYLIYTEIEHVTTELIPDKIFFSVFHSISAFCNAGFSTLSGNLYDPAVRTLYGLQCWIALLIVLGGIGFPIVFNFGKLFQYYIRKGISRLKGSHTFQPRQVHIVNLTTRIVIPATFFLIVSGTLLFWFFESDNTLKGLSWSGKLASSFLGAVTPRTAGFSNVDMGALLPSTVFLTIILMWIGASPMSTGGGIKTTTFVVACANIWSVIRNKERVEIGYRQLTPGTVNRASAVIFLSLIWIGIATLLLIVLEPQASVTQAIFEVISALSTVGLSLNLTPTLSEAGKILICLTMFVGRVGLVVLLTGMVHQQRAQFYTYPDENVIL